MKHVFVVAGLYVKQVEMMRTGILMGLRPSSTKRPGMWELPGGKVEADESFAAALVREWKEELNLTVTPGETITSATFEVENQTLLTVTLMEVARIAEHERGALSHTIRLTAHDDWNFHSPGYAVERLPCTPAFYLHYGAMRRFIEERHRPKEI